MAEKMPEDKGTRSALLMTPSKNSGATQTLTETPEEKKRACQTQQQSTEKKAKLEGNGGNKDAHGNAGNREQADQANQANQLDDDDNSDNNSYYSGTTLGEAFPPGKGHEEELEGFQPP